MEDSAMRCAECESALAFHRALSKILTCSHRDLSARALTPLHYDLLLALKIARQGNSFDLRSLAKGLGVRRSVVSAALEELHDRRLIRVSPGSKRGSQTQSRWRRPGLKARAHGVRRMEAPCSSSMHDLYAPS